MCTLTGVTAHSRDKAGSVGRIPSCRIRRALGSSREGLPRNDLQRSSREFDHAFHEEAYAPGVPPKSANAGMTVFGGMIVLSAIFAQSLIMVNLPCESC